MSHIDPCFGRKDPADAPLTLALDARGRATSCKAFSQPDKG